jgi:hypothetical protein
MKRQAINWRYLAKGALLVFFSMMLTMQPDINAQDLGQADALDVYEAVVRYQIKSFDFKSYCVLVEGKDADNEFSRRFNLHQVKGASVCRGKSKGKFSWRIFDNKTRKNSVILEVGPIRWLTKDEAEVTGGYQLGPLGMARGDYHVIREGTQWVVTEFEVHFQS